MSSHFDEAHALYREWLNLTPQRQAVQEYWQRTTGIVQALAESDFEGDYGRCLDAMEAGLNLDWHMPAHTSVASDAAIWNYTEQFAWA